MSRTVEAAFREYTHADELEFYVDNRLWTLPKYRELLFLR